jgi:hypothetical protein
MYIGREPHQVTIVLSSNMRALFHDRAAEFLETI